MISSILHFYIAREVLMRSYATMHIFIFLKLAVMGISRSLSREVSLEQEASRILFWSLVVIKIEDSCNTMVNYELSYRPIGYDLLERRKYNRRISRVVGGSSTFVDYHMKKMM